MRPPAPSPSPPAPLSLERRRWTAVFALPFAAVVGLFGPLSLFWWPQLLGARLGLALGLMSALMSLALAAAIGRSALRALREEGPALVVDARGITDNFHLRTHLPWSAIASVSVDHGDGDDLMLVLHPGARLPGGGVAPRAGVWRRVRRAFSGGDLRIPLGGLVYDHRRLREALKAHLALQASDKAR